MPTSSASSVKMPDCVWDWGRTVCRMSLTGDNRTPENGAGTEVDPWRRNNIAARRAACARWRRKNRNPCLLVFGAGTRAGVRDGNLISARSPKLRSVRRHNIGPSTLVYRANTARSHSLVAAIALLRAQIRGLGGDIGSRPAAEIFSTTPPDFESLA
jgi:hypothetical protein